MKAAWEQNGSKLLAPAKSFSQALRDGHPETSRLEPLSTILI